MPLPTIIGLDHVVVTVRDLDAAAEGWKRIGFTISPPGTHSAHMGTGNYTIMFGEDYIELLGVLAATEHNAPSRAYLEKQEGIERMAFTTTDAAAGVAALKQRGLAATGPLKFGRPVDMPDGSKSEARFQTMMWPVDERPAGARLFACQHFTRETVWIPELTRHANTAARINRVELISPDPKAAATHMQRLTDMSFSNEADGALRMPTGPNRADFVFMDQATFARRHPKVPTDDLSKDGVAALVIGVGDLTKAKAAAGPAAIAGDGRVTVPASAANGLLVVFEA